MDGLGLAIPPSTVPCLRYRTPSVWENVYLLDLIRSQASITIPTTMEASATLNTGQKPNLMKSVTCSKRSLSTKLPKAPPSWRPRLNRNSGPGKECLRYKIIRMEMPAMEAKMSGNVWSRNRPKALPVLKAFIIRKAPSDGMDSPRSRLERTRCLVSWSVVKTIHITEIRIQSLYQGTQRGRNHFPPDDHEPVVIRRIAPRKKSEAWSVTAPPMPTS